MKPLLVSFFAFLLGYSFLFDEEEEVRLSPLDWDALKPNTALVEEKDCVLLYMDTSSLPFIHFPHLILMGDELLVK